MSEATLAAQKFLRGLFIARTDLTDLVPASAIFDKSDLPSTFPCIVIGTGQFVADDAQCVAAGDVYMDCHVWTKEAGFEACKLIVGEMRRAVRDASDVVDGFGLDAYFQDAIFLRDPDGVHRHAVVNFHILAEDTVGVV